MLLSWIKETLYLTFREEGLWKKCFVESVIHCELRYIQVYFCQLFLVWKISFVQKFSFFTLCSKYLLFYVCIFCFLSNLACEYWLVYNLLTLASFQCNTVTANTFGKDVLRNLNHWVHKFNYGASKSSILKV